ncbi:type IV pilus biogenesis/stability protein PilW [Cycloclasticus sp.]|uniref:type IV pilus biogenesis/stability protein PilW n=1 Tax=Cycloclasticus sp. TaxID=2024830 RepID=UPI000C0F52C0|nr:type IV pilus biogenesis/stability protein PilW [Cycloclasticus sp.]PHR51873.1 MAG: type IV pilus biogenesis/stability protein PilW [Cycloclasticus sp.]
MNKWIIQIIMLCFLATLVACQPQQVKENSASSIQGTEKSPADVYVSLGVEYMKRGMNEVALEKLKKAIDVDPFSSNAHNVLAVLYDRLGEKSLAGEHYKKAVTLSPRNSSAQNNYARYLCSMNEFELANQHFNIAVKNPLYRSAVAALTNAGTCAWKAGQLDKAESYYRTALQRNNRSAVTLLQMAKLKFEMQNYLSVRAYLQRFKEVSKHTPASLWLGIQAEDKLGDSDSVASYILQLKRLYPDSHEMGLLEKSKFKR